MKRASCENDDSSERTWEIERVLYISFCLWILIASTEKLYTSIYRF